jgi:hypothetical protein
VLDRHRDHPTADQDKGAGQPAPDLQDGEADVLEIPSPELEQLVNVVPEIRA